MAVQLKTKNSILLILLLWFCVKPSFAQSDKKIYKDAVNLFEKSNYLEAGDLFMILSDEFVAKQPKVVYYIVRISMETGQWKAAQAFLDLDYDEKSWRKFDNIGSIVKSVDEKVYQYDSLIDLAIKSSEKEDFTSSVSLVKQACQIDSFHLASHVLLCEYFYRDSLYDQSILHANRVLLYDSLNYYALQFKGLSLTGMGRISEGENLIQKCITVDPENKSAYVAQALACFQSQRFKEATKYFDAAIAIDPLQYGLYPLRAQCNFIQNKYPEAIADYEYYETKSEKKLEPTPAMFLAESYYQTNQTLKSSQRYESIIQSGYLTGAIAHAYARQGIEYAYEQYDQGRINKSNFLDVVKQKTFYLDSAIHMEPEAEKYYRTRVYAHMTLSEYPQAIELCKVIVKLKPNTHESYEFANDIFKNAGVDIEVRQKNLKYGITKLKSLPADSLEKNLGLGRLYQFYWGATGNKKFIDSANLYLDEYTKINSHKTVDVLLIKADFALMYFHDYDKASTYLSNLQNHSPSPKQLITAMNLAHDYELKNPFQSLVEYSKTNYPNDPHLKNYVEYIMRH